MFQPRSPIDRTALAAEIETPIFHAVRNAQTPIFHALLVDGRPPRHLATRREDDPMAEFRRDPLTAPIPVQAMAETWTPSQPERSRRRGRHRRLSPAPA